MPVTYAPHNNKVKQDDEAVTANMGYFTGADGKEHWGIEVIHKHSPRLVTESSDDTQALFQDEETSQSLPLSASSEFHLDDTTAGGSSASIRSHVASFDDVRSQRSSASWSGESLHERAYTHQERQL